MRSLPSRLRADLPSRSMASIATGFVGAHRSWHEPETGPYPIAGKAIQRRRLRGRGRHLAIGRQRLMFDLRHGLVGAGLPRCSRVLSVAEGEGPRLPGIQGCRRHWLCWTLTRQEQ
jgi:hypothetical protein